ncbi:recombinase family protein [Bradyrhizobium sp. 200]|uniref:recombinase family protein n=1 Tax=Bradyrhizobium sp. 200 TaxID=2782665 RepID=UPI001FFE880E|nr:recombinase family protein [Bradyrhizobium sp. 200]
MTAILKNPAYAGAFVYGRTWQKPSRTPGAPPQKSRRTGMDWRIAVRDKYPAYIDWETFLREDPGHAARQSRRIPTH